MMSCRQWFRSIYQRVGIVLIATISLAFVTPSVVIGQAELEGSEPDTATQYYRQRLAILDADREAFVQGLVEQWASPSSDSADHLYETFRRLNSDKLLAIQDATNLEAVDAILLGDSPNNLPATPLVLGSLSGDYVYTPVNPCRVVDTRFAAGGGVPIAAGTTRDFKVYGTLIEIQNQGGSTACSAPNGEPRAAHINVTVVPVGGNGFVKVYPDASPQPNASLVNFKLGTNIANAATIRTRFSTSAVPDITVFTSATAHIIIDVLGYYYPAKGSQEGREFVSVTNVPNDPIQVVGSLSIFIPGPGSIVVHGSGIGHCFGADTRLALGIGDSTTTYDQRTVSGLSNGTDSLDRSFPMHVQQIYSVNGPSNKTIYLLTDRINADDSFQADLGNGTLTALFVPE